MIQGEERGDNSMTDKSKKETRRNKIDGHGEELTSYNFFKVFIV